MRVNKWKYASLVLAISACLGAGGTYAFVSDEVSVINEVQMGDIDIAIREYELSEGKEIPYQNQKLVQPGDVISKIPRIQNLAEPCWIRVQVKYQSDLKHTEGLSEECLSGFSSKWIRRGDYYYYTEVLKKKESVDLFHEVRLPSEWDNHHAGQDLTLDIRAEAIQAIHFKPDFDAMSPWGNENIELCVHEANDRITEKKEILQHRIEFNGSAHKLISISDNFFSNFETAMPGDSLSDYAYLENTTERDTTLYFRTERLKQGKEQDQLLQKLKLRLSLDGKLLYVGPLHTESLGQEKKLVTLKPEEQGKLEFTVEVPKELKNWSALEQTAVKWIFRVEEKDIPEEPEKEIPDITVTPTLIPEGFEYEQTEPVKTADETKGGVWMWLMIFSMEVLTLSGVRLWKGEKENEEKNS